MKMKKTNCRAFDEKTCGSVMFTRENGIKKYLLIKTTAVI